MKKYRILLLEEYTLIRETLSEAINATNCFEVVATTGQEHEALELIQTYSPDIVLVDINLSSLTSFDIVSTIKMLSGKTKIIILSRYPRVEYAKKTMKMGAAAFITKTSSFSEMMNAISKIIYGETYLCKEIKDALTASIMHEENTVFRLTEKELEIIKYVSSGYSSKEISQIVQTSKSTINAHRRNVLRKLDMKNSAELVHFAYRHGLTKAI